MPRRDVQRKLLHWFRREKRELPWRGTADPYLIWVSEVMLQQTTVGAVRKRYPEFLRQFPDVASLARATEDQVLAAWSGLGYYARARNLHRAAREIVRGHGGAIPRDTRSLRALPGFGDYTAAAVASLAFAVRAPAVEANVERVLSRVFALRGNAGSRELRERVLFRMEQLLPARRPGDLAAALMDLGQLVCTPRRPSCPDCPVAADCEARRRGRPERFPRRRARPVPLRLSLAAAVAERGARVLLVRRQSSWLGGLWEFPSAEGASAPEARRRLARRIAELGLELTSAAPIGETRHAVVNRRVHVEVFRTRPIDRNGAVPRRGARWFLPAELHGAAVPTLTRKIAATAALRSG